MATRSDTFDRADSSSLGSDWTEDSGDWAIVSNNIRCNTTAGAYRKLRWVGAAMDSDNYYVEMPARSGNSGIGIGPAARLAASGTVSYYAFIIFGGDAAYLIYINGGSETILDTGSAITASTNYTLRIEVDGTTIRGYLNGVLDCEATNSALTSGPPGIAGYGGNNANTYGTTWTAVDLASGTTYNQSAAGSVAPSGANVRQTSKTLAGALGLAGAALRSTAKNLTGVLAPTGATLRSTAKTLAGALGVAGALTAVRTVLASVGGVLTPAGALARSTAKTAAGVLAPAGDALRSTAKNLTGALGVAGDVLRSTAKNLAGVLGLAGALASELISGVLTQAVGGTLALAGAVSRQTNITVAGALTATGALARQVAKTLAGVLGLAGTLARSAFGPSTSKLDVTLSDAALTVLTIGDAAQTTLTIGDAAQTTLTIGDVTV